MVAGAGAALKSPAAAGEVVRTEETDWPVGGPVVAVFGGDPPAAAGRTAAARVL